MPLSIITEDNEVTFTGYTGTGPLNFTFPYFQKEDLNVSVNGVTLARSAWDDTPNAEDNGNDGGSIILNASVTGATVRIWRDTVRLRATQFGAGGATPRQVDLEMNRMVTMAQDTRSRFDDFESVSNALEDVSTVAEAINDGTIDDLLDGQVGRVATYAALTAIPESGRSDDMVVYVASRATDGDGGEGHWRFDAASSATANGGTILAPDAGTGRWLRQIAANIYDHAWFASSADARTAANASSARPFNIGDIEITTNGNNELVLAAGDFITLSSTGGLKVGGWILAQDGGAASAAAFVPVAANTVMEVVINGSGAPGDIPTAEVASLTIVHQAGANEQRIQFAAQGPNGGGLDAYVINQIVTGTGAYKDLLFINGSGTTPAMRHRTDNHMQFETDPYMTNGRTLYGRNAANSAFIPIITVDGSDDIQIGNSAPTGTLIGIGVNHADNDPIFVRVAGANLNMSSGANDSAGAGFRALRVPNI